MEQEWTIQRIVAWIIKESATTKEQGDTFERLMRLFFKEEPSWKAQFEEVWLWDDWPLRDGHDHGIDLVAKNVGEDSYTAIQAKCYAPSTRVNKSEIDSFVSASNREHFTRRIFVSTGHDLSPNAEKELENALPPVTRLSLADLASYEIDWSKWSPEADALTRTSAKTPMDHQEKARAMVREAFVDEGQDRGQLIMACGTGKTYTGQIVAEDLLGGDGLVLILAPSIALISQTITSWYADRTIPFTAHSICSDADATGDTSDLSPYDLVVPATTDPEKLVANIQRAPTGLNVVFSTYQSLPQIMAAQKEHGLNDFDLVICDEAHRTTGTTDNADTPSGFRLIHHNERIRAKRRLYMTATPKVYSDSVSTKAEESGQWVASMDNEDMFGKVLYAIGFREAVNLGLLVDYKVVVFGVETSDLDALFTQGALDSEKVPAEELAKWVGVLNTLAKREQVSGHERAFDEGDDIPLQRAVAFTSRINKSKEVQAGLPHLAEKFQTITGVDGEHLQIEVQHVDGTQSASKRNEALAWLADQPGKQVARVLTNAQCLTEGIDVPALDAIVMLEPRESQIDIVQAIGRVMRSHTDPITGKEKEFGYVIIPVPVLPGQSVEEKLDARGFRTIHQVVSALRSHDPDLNHEINILRFADTSEGSGDGDPTPDDKFVFQGTLAFGKDLAELKEKCWAEMVRRVGDVHYLARWTDTVVDTAAALEQRIAAVIERRGMKGKFQDFVAGLRADLNEGISETDAIALLAQHLITEPVFDSMFPGYLIAASNPVAHSMRTMLDALTGKGLEAEVEDLQGFYQTVRDHVRGLEGNPRARQKVLIKLYEDFFQKAFPKQADALGITYTPTQVTDFIIHAADDALRRHFDGASLTDEGVHVIDPFTGTGNFPVQMLRSGLIKPHDLARKFTNELHANEIQLLAYYIATVNIETTYHALASGDPEKPVQAFPGIVYTDTFQLGEDANDDHLFEIFPNNHKRVSRQNSLDIRVVVGNPPYSVGQKNQNDDNENQSYPKLDNRIVATYRKAGAKQFARQKLKDSYIRAIRWGSDRVLSGGGVMAYVTNGGYIDTKTFDGFRKSLIKEFDHVYVYNLRGGVRGKKGDEATAEGGSVFGILTSTAILIAVSNGDKPAGQGVLHYAQTPDGQTASDKLDSLAAAAISGSPLDAVEWEVVTPNAEGDWINHRSKSLEEFRPVHSEGKGDGGIFASKSPGVVTARDPWHWNSSKPALQANVQKLVGFLNDEAARYIASGLTAPKAKERQNQVKDFVSNDPERVSWHYGDYSRIASHKTYEMPDDGDFAEGMYRPFHRRHVLTSPALNRSPGSMKSYFPQGCDNRVITLSSGSGRVSFSALMVDSTYDFSFYVDSAQGFPLYVYDTGTPDEGQLVNDPIRMSGISGDALSDFQELDSSITSEAVFNYVYAVLHHQEYRAQFESDLRVRLPRIPDPKSAETFWAFSEAGQLLSDLHLGYESADVWTGLEIREKTSDPDPTVKSMKFPKTLPNPDPTKTSKVADKSVIIVNDEISVHGIPSRCYEYELGSRSALEWVIDQWQYKIDTRNKSGLVNDPNDWANEHGDPRYIIDLIGKVVTVSMETLDIIDALPELDLPD